MVLQLHELRAVRPSTATPLEKDQHHRSLLQLLR
jgi:hypothetical protein